MSQDQVIATAASLEKQRKAKAAAKKGEKAGPHVDVIDRLDYSSAGPASTYPDPLILYTPLLYTPYDQPLPRRTWPAHSRSSHPRCPHADEPPHQPFTTTAHSMPALPLATVIARKPLCSPGRPPRKSAAKKASSAFRLPTINAPRPSHELQ
jgi:hypothetical protein